MFAGGRVSGEKWCLGVAAPLAWRTLVVAATAAAAYMALYASAWLPWEAGSDPALHLLISDGTYVSWRQGADGWRWAQFLLPAVAAACGLAALVRTRRSGASTLRWSALGAVLTLAALYVTWLGLRDLGGLGLAWPA